VSKHIKCNIPVAESQCTAVFIVLINLSMDIND